MAKFYRAESTGKGFITHEDQERNYIGSYCDGIYFTEGNDEWVSRVEATEISEADAKAEFDSQKSSSLSDLQIQLDSETDEVEQKRLEYEIASVSSQSYPSIN